MKPTPDTATRRREHQRRIYKVSILLNEQEHKALKKYCDRYTVTNRSKLIRETLIRNILERFAADGPTLFDQPK